MRKRRNKEKLEYGIIAAKQPCKLLAAHVHGTWRHITTICIHQARIGGHLCCLVCSSWPTLEVVECCLVFEHDKLVRLKTCCVLQCKWCITAERSANPNGSTHPNLLFKESYDKMCLRTSGTVRISFAQIRSGSTPFESLKINVWAHWPVFSTHGQLVGGAEKNLSLKN